MQQSKKQRAAQAQAEAEVEQKPPVRQQRQAKQRALLQQAQMSGSHDEDEDDEGEEEDGNGGSAKCVTASGEAISLDTLQGLFHLTLLEAAKRLGVCRTNMKKICRKHGIARWPKRALDRNNRLLAAQQLVGLAAQPGGATAQAVLATLAGQVQQAGGVSTLLNLQQAHQRNHQQKLEGSGAPALLATSSAQAAGLQMLGQHQQLTGLSAANAQLLFQHQQLASAQAQKASAAIAAVAAAASKKPQPSRGAGGGSLSAAAAAAGGRSVKAEATPSRAAAAGSPSSPRQEPREPRGNSPTGLAALAAAAAAALASDSPAASSGAAGGALPTGLAGLQAQLQAGSFGNLHSIANKLSLQSSQAQHALLQQLHGQPQRQMNLQQALQQQFQQQQFAAGHGALTAAQQLGQLMTQPLSGPGSLGSRPVLKDPWRELERLRSAFLPFVETNVTILRSRLSEPSLDSDSRELFKQLLPRWLYHYAFLTQTPATAVRGARQMRRIRPLGLVRAEVTLLSPGVGGL